MKKPRVTFTHKGRKYIGSNIGTGIKAFLIDGVKQNIENHMSQFDAELDEENGSVEVDVTDEGKVSLKFINVSAELQTKIAQSLQG